MTQQLPLARVAKIYTKAVARGEQPAKAVREALDIPVSTAGYWIRRAKDQGLIPDVTGKPRNPKVARVAKAVGVEYAVLERAICKYAAGDIRI